MGGKLVNSQICGNETFLKKQWVEEEIKREIKKILRQMKMEINIPKFMEFKK